MADFAAVLRKTIDGLKENTPEMRQKVYDKARSTIEAKLAAAKPAPSETVAQRQRNLLEEAIAEVEAGYAEPPPAEADVEDELEHVFSELEQPVEQAEPSPEPASDHDETAAVYGPETDVPPPWSDPEETEGGEASGEDSSVGHPDDEAGPAPLPGTPRRRGGAAGWVVAVLLLLVLAGGAFGAWFYKDDLARVANLEWLGNIGADEGEQAGEADSTGDETVAAEGEEPSDAQTPQAGDGREPEQAAADEPGSAAQKFTQRLLPDGSEVDEGPAGGEPGIGEGTSVASSTSDENATAQAAAGGDEAGTQGASQALPVGQKAIFYEERTNVSQGSAESGAVVWSLVEETPGDDLPAEPAIRGEVTIPGKNMELKMTIRRNADQSLPASHVVELIFLTPDDFEGGGIENVLRMTMKNSEQATGNQLLGIPAKIADGFFLIALNDSKAERETNELLMRRQSWIDIPIVYKSGRRALITMEKGVPGEKVFNDALAAWQNESSG